MKSVFSIVVFIFLLMAGCDSETLEQQTVKKNRVPEKSLIKANRYLVVQEQHDIDNYVSRHHWKMKTTGTGLRYMIYKHGNGPRATKGKIAVIDYTIYLITGDKVYSSDQDGPKVFEIGHGGIESGLEEGILLLKVGDKAKFVLPSHLAYGLLGDEKKIPPRMPIVYDVELKVLK